MRTAIAVLLVVLCCGAAMADRPCENATVRGAAAFAAFEAAGGFGSYHVLTFCGDSDNEEHSMIGPGVDLAELDEIEVYDLTHNPKCTDVISCRMAVNADCKLIGQTVDYSVDVTVTYNAETGVGTCSGSCTGAASVIITCAGY